MPRRPRSRLALRPELLALTAFGAFVRFGRLFTPNAVVFDEHHYIGFASHYFTHTYYYDVHPPLDVHREMEAGNRALERVTNAGASPWYTWPSMRHPIGYWQGPAPGVPVLGSQPGPPRPRSASS